jgi:hypothetical protein
LAWLPPSSATNFSAAARTSGSSAVAFLAKDFAVNIYSERNLQEFDVKRIFEQAVPAGPQVWLVRCSGKFPMPFPKSFSVREFMARVF